MLGIEGILNKLIVISGPSAIALKNLTTHPTYKSLGDLGVPRPAGL